MRMKGRVAKLLPRSAIRGLKLLAALLPLLAGAELASAQGDRPCDQVATGVNSLCLLPASQSVLLNETFSVQLDMSFFDSTVGGEVFLDFDHSALSLSAVNFDASFPDDPD